MLQFLGVRDEGTALRNIRITESPENLSLFKSPIFGSQVFFKDGYHDIFRLSTSIENLPPHPRAGSEPLIKFQKVVRRIEAQLKINRDIEKMKNF